MDALWCPRGSDAVTPTVRGLVLVGGKSSRFGTDKALATRDGVPFVARAVRLLDSLRLSPVVSLRRGAHYPFLRCPVVYDRMPDQGPLGGICAAMAAYADVSFLVLTCDMPALTRVAVSKLLERRDASASATVYSVENEPQPFPGVYEASAFETVRQNLRDGRRSLRAFLESVPSVKEIPWEGDPSVFLNVNRPHDLLAQAF